MYENCCIFMRFAVFCVFSHSVIFLWEREEGLPILTRPIIRGVKNAIFSWFLMCEKICTFIRFAVFSMNNHNGYFTPKKIIISFSMIFMFFFFRSNESRTRKVIFFFNFLHINVQNFRQIRKGWGFLKWKLFNKKVKFNFHEVNFYLITWFCLFSEHIYFSFLF